MLGLLSRLSRCPPMASRLSVIARQAPQLAHVCSSVLPQSAGSGFFGATRAVHTSLSLCSAKEPATIPLEMPGDHAGKIIKWQKSVGDAVKEGDLLCIIETEVRWAWLCAVGAWLGNTIESRGTLHWLLYMFVP